MSSELSYTSRTETVEAELIYQYNWHWNEHKRALNRPQSGSFSIKPHVDVKSNWEAVKTNTNGRAFKNNKEVNYVTSFIYWIKFCKLNCLICRNGPYYHPAWYSEPFTGSNFNPFSVRTISFPLTNKCIVWISVLNYDIYRSHLRELKLWKRN